jgi:hypothetical protein
MHYRTSRIYFLEPADGFLELFSKVQRLATPALEIAQLSVEQGPVAVVPAAP